MRITFPISTLVLLLAAGHANAGLSGSVAIGVDTSSLGKKAADEIQDGAAAQILAGLTTANMVLTPVSDAQVIAQVQACESTDCLQAVAKSAQLALVVQARILDNKGAARDSGKSSKGTRSNKRGKIDYVVSMKVAGPDGAPEGWHEKTDCQACDADETKHMAFLLAALIGERVANEAPPPKPTPAVTEAPTPPAPAPRPAPAPMVRRPPPVRLPIPSPPEPNDEWTMPRYASSLILAAGLAVVGAGIYALHIDGRGTCSLAAGQQACPKIHDTKALGTGLVMGGSVVALGGLASLIFFAPASTGSHLAFSWTGSSLFLSGAF